LLFASFLNDFLNQRIVLLAFVEILGLLPWPSGVENEPTEYIQIFLFFQNALRVGIDQANLLPDLLLQQTQLVLVAFILLLLLGYVFAGIVATSRLHPFSDLLSVV